MAWVRREYDGPDWGGIWDSSDGWQVNKRTDSKEYLLIDATMPSDWPASPVLGKFNTLREAKDHARALNNEPPER